MIRRFYILLAAAVMAAISAGAQSLATQADSAYNSGDFAKAQELYEQAATIDGVSPQLYYNMGNTAYRQGHLGQAVLYYERALKLDPSMSDARANLAFVNTKIIDKPEDDSSFLGNLHQSISSFMSPNAWAWTAFTLFLLVLGCVALYIFSAGIAWRKAGFFGGFVIMLSFIYALVIAAQTSSAPYSMDRAVIIVPTSNLSTSPGSSAAAAKIIPVHEGTAVEITDSTSIPGQHGMETWYDVKINNSTRAWVKSNDVEKI